MRSALAAAGKRVGARLSVGLHALFGSRVREGAGFGILMYHRVANARAGLPAPTWNVTPASFRAQMEGLIALGYRVVSLRSAIHHETEGRPLPPRTMVITFDDGYENVYLHAWPVLRELNIPATVFVPTAYVDSMSPFPFDGWGSAHHTKSPPSDWRPLTWEHCREMEQSGGRLVEIGSHTHTHADFRGNAEGLQRDLSSSAAELRSQLGAVRADRADFTFAFPYGGRRLGYSSDVLMEVVRRSGAICALTSETELARGSPFGWGRYEVVDSDTAATIAAKLEGWYDWMGKTRDAFRFFLPPRASAAAGPSS